MSKPIYVEIDIARTVDEVWHYTQTPELHEQWDMRFTSITYLPREHLDDPQRFTYTTKAIITISGWGQSTGTHEKSTGVKTSALHFGTEQKIAPIQQGKGYWQYIPNGETVRFLTQYDYRSYNGLLGKLVDTCFRPVVGWGTALSFDVLKRWLETGERPTTQYRRFFSYYMLCWLLAFVWIYLGLVPKVLLQHPLEVEMLMELSSLPQQTARIAIIAVGVAEIILGLLLVIPRYQRFLLRAQVVLYPLLTISAIVAAPHTASDPFNVVTLNGVLWGIALVALWQRHALPTASTCRRTRGVQ